MDINQRENARWMYINKYRCLSALADPEKGAPPKRLRTYDFSMPQTL